MTTLRWLLGALATCGLLAGCAGRLAAPTEADAARAATAWPEIRLDDLQRGRQLYLQHCTNCHAAYVPATHPPERWPAVVGEMAARAKLSPSEDRDVTRYLVAMSRGEPPR